MWNTLLHLLVAFFSYVAVVVAQARAQDFHLRYAQVMKQLYFFSEMVECQFVGFATPGVPEPGRLPSERASGDSRLVRFCKYRV